VEKGGTPTQKEWKQVEQIPPYSTSFHLFPRVSTLKLFLGRNFTLIAVRRMRVRSRLTSSLFQRVPAYSNVFFSEIRMNTDYQSEGAKEKYRVQGFNAQIFDLENSLPCPQGRELASPSRGEGIGSTI
jgi:hypothetical protein